MCPRNLVSSIVAAAVLGAGFFALTAARTSDAAEVIDFGTIRRAVEPADDVALLHATNARIREFVIPVTHDTIEIADPSESSRWVRRRSSPT